MGRERKNRQQIVQKPLKQCLNNNKVKQENIDLQQLQSKGHSGVSDLKFIMKKKILKVRHLPPPLSFRPSSASLYTDQPSSVIRPIDTYNKLGPECQVIGLTITRSPGVRKISLFALL